MTPIEKKLEAMRQHLKSKGDCPASLPEVETVQAACCAAFGVTLSDLFGRVRGEMVDLARIASMTICRRRLRLSLNRVARFHRRGSHKVAQHAVAVFDGAIKSDPVFRAGVARVESLLKEFND